MGFEEEVMKLKSHNKETYIIARSRRFPFRKYLFKLEHLEALEVEFLTLKPEKRGKKS